MSAILIILITHTIIAVPWMLIKILSMVIKRKGSLKQLFWVVEMYYSITYVFLQHIRMLRRRFLKTSITKL